MEKFWKYFWQQKIYELLSIPLIIFVPYYLGKFCLFLFGEKFVLFLGGSETEITNTALWVCGFGITIILAAIFITNWMIANCRVEDE